MKSRTVRFALVTLTAAAASIAAASAEDFSADRMSAGKEAYGSKRYSEAADQFRIASFGLLDDPRRLVESLARLALAQAALRPPADNSAAITRIVELEKRFAVFGAAELEPDARAAIGRLIVERVPAETLAGIPGFSGLVETPEQKIAKLPPKERAKALESAARGDPQAVRWPLALCRLAVETGDPRSLERWSGRALEIAPADRQALAFRAHARALRSKCGEALSDLRALSPADFERWPDLRADDFVCRAAEKDWKGAAGLLASVPADAFARTDVQLAKAQMERQRTPKPDPPSKVAAAPPRDAPPDPGPNLAEVRRLLAAGRPADAESMARRLVEAEPSRREYRLTLLEAACLARDFTAAAGEIARVVPFGEGEAPFEFYSAVALYETGRVAEARRHFEHARTRIVATAYTDYYARKLLGS